MKPSLWFIVPAHGRLALTRICLRQLRATCDALEHVDATAVVIADDENLDTARDFGFATIERDNRFTSRRFNDGIQLALDPAINPRRVDYVVPCGSDDWVDAGLFDKLPPAGTVYGFQSLAFVREDGLELSTAFARYEGGCGIRIYPRDVMAAMAYRPADEHRKRGCDTSMLVNLRMAHGDDLRVEHRPSEPWQIVDWKTQAANLNSYTAVGIWKQRGAERQGDPFTELAEHWPAEALDDMRHHYHGALVVA